MEMQSRNAPWSSQINRTDTESIVRGRAITTTTGGFTGIEEQGYVQSWRRHLELESKEVNDDIRSAVMRLHEEFCHSEAQWKCMCCFQKKPKLDIVTFRVRTRKACPGSVRGARPQTPSFLLRFMRFGNAEATSRLHRQTGHRARREDRRCPVDYKTSDNPGRPT